MQGKMTVNISLEEVVLAVTICGMFHLTKTKLVNEKLNSLA